MPRSAVFYSTAEKCSPVTKVICNISGKTDGIIGREDAVRSLDCSISQFLLVPKLNVSCLTVFNLITECVRSGTFVHDDGGWAEMCCVFFFGTATTNNLFFASAPEKTKKKEGRNKVKLISNDDDDEDDDFINFNV